MHAARLDDSARLRRVRRVLTDGAEHSTMDIVTRANVRAVNSIISELRANGLDIACRQTQDEAGARVWLYHLPPPEDRA